MKTIAGTIYEHLLEIGQVPFIIYYEYYLESNQLEAAISIIGQEIDGLETTLGIEHNLVLQHKAHLAPIISNYGRWKEAEDLEVQLMETRKECWVRSIQVRWPARPTWVRLNLAQHVFEALQTPGMQNLQSAAGGRVVRYHRAPSSPSPCSSDPKS